MRRWLIIVALTVFAAACSTPHGSPETTVTVGTFNIEWLGDGLDDRQQRTAQDHLRIADVIIKSGADVLGLQEIENQEALDLVLRYLDDYDGFVARTDAPQNVGVVYKKDVQVDSVQIYRPLQLDRPDRLRSGLVVKCRKGAFEWVQLIVHFKSTSRYDSTSTLQDLSRSMRSGQVDAANAWADSVLGTGQQNVMIVGDLNDYPERKRLSTLTSLVTNENLVFLTAGLSSCRDRNWSLIDHVVASRSAADRLIDDSPRTENIHKYLGDREVEGVSDHCPVVARFSTLESP